MKKLNDRITNLFKGEDTRLIESICHTADVFVNEYPFILPIDNRKAETIVLSNARVSFHSLDLSARLDFDANILISVNYGYKGDKYEGGVYQYRLDIDYNSRVRITRNNNQAHEVRVNCAMRKAINDRIKSLIQIK